MKACTHLLSALLRGCMALGFGGLAWLFPACEIAPPDEIPSGVIRPTILWEKDVTDATGSNGGLWNLAYWNQHLIYTVHHFSNIADTATVFRSRASDGTVVDSLVLPGVGQAYFDQALVSGKFLVLPSYPGAVSASYTGVNMETMQLAWTTSVPAGQYPVQWGNILLFQDNAATWHRLNMETGTHRPLLPPTFTGILAGTPRLFISGTQDTTLVGIFYQETGPYRLQQFSLSGDSLQMDVPLTEFQGDRNMPYALVMNSTYVYIANDAQLSCRRSTDGAMVWFRTFSPDSPNYRKPLATENEVIFSLYETTDGGNVYCHSLDPATGQDRWVREADQDGIPISLDGGFIIDGMLFIYNFPFRLSDGVPYWNDVDGFLDWWNIPFMQLPVPDPVTKDLYYIGYENKRAKLYYVKNPK